MADTAPVFVKINDYKEVLDIMDVLKAKVAESKETIQQINQLKAEEDKELDDWNRNLDDIAKRIATIDKTLFEPDV
ncbi:MAG: hypothetical protein V1725_01530 [archaeon]